MQRIIFDKKPAQDETSQDTKIEALAQPVVMQDRANPVSLIPRDLYFYIFEFIAAENVSTLRALGSANRMFYDYVKQYSITPDRIYFAVGSTLTVINGNRYDNVISRLFMDSVGSLFTPTFASIKSSIDNDYTLYFTNRVDANYFCDKNASTTYIKYHDIEYVDAISGIVAVKFNHRDAFSLRRHNLKLTIDNACTVFTTKPTNITHTAFAFFRGKRIMEEKLLENNKPQNRCNIL